MGQETRRKSYPPNTNAVLEAEKPSTRPSRSTSWRKKLLSGIKSAYPWNFSPNPPSSFPVAYCLAAPFAMSPP